MLVYVLSCKLNGFSFIAGSIPVLPILIYLYISSVLKKIFLIRKCIYIKNFLYKWEREGIKK